MQGHYRRGRYASWHGAQQTLDLDLSALGEEVALLAVRADTVGIITRVGALSKKLNIENVTESTESQNCIRKHDCAHNLQIIDDAPVDV